ncbi:sensor histidine kinase [Curtobacterium luteum]|uniref:sensor histidine kinase n=1 Tax=Curtobacterium luteum TaxID=33881 RepID=UPI000736E895|nr:HAMP domain-containing sensor histidine kinase [Curtobacterium luteum]
MSRDRRRSDPARRRIARIRWTTTLVFAAATAACLGVLVGAALRIDLASRGAATDTDLRQRVETLADLVTFGDDQALHLGPVQQSHAARSVPVYGFVTDRAIAYAQPGQDALPSDAVLRRALADARRADGQVVTFVAPEASAPDGPELHWAAATITDFGTYVDGGYTGGIAVAGKPVAAAVGHTQLRTGLLLAAGALTLVAAAFAHVVAGIAVRPAVRGLEAQEQFLVEAAHELRTPLATLRVLAERRAPPEQTLRQVDRLVALTERLLLRARSAGPAVVETGPVRLDQVVERAVIAHVEAAGPGAAADGDLELRTEPTVVDADPELVERIVENLLANAERHGAAPVAVLVGGGVLRVTDRGPGIPARDRRRALRPGATGGLGTGTGLAIVQWAAREQRAELSLRPTAPDDTEHPGLTVLVRFRQARDGASSGSHARGRNVDAGEQEGA